MVQVSTDVVSHGGHILVEYTKQVNEIILNSRGQNIQSVVLWKVWRKMSYVSFDITHGVRK